MQDARHKNSAANLPVKDDVPALFQKAKSRPNLGTGSPQGWIFRQTPTACFKFGQVAIRLRFTPGAESIFSDCDQIGFRKTGVPGDSQKLSLRRGGQIQLFANTPEHVASGDAARVPRIDGSAQSGQLGFVFFFFPLHGPQRGPDDLACIFVTAALYLGYNHPIQLVRQIYVACRHSGYPVKATDL